MKAKARNTDPRTSKDAAKSVKPQAQMMALLKAFKKSSGKIGITAETAYAVATQMGAWVTPTGYWKRVSDLQQAGFIRESGYTATASSGRQARCFVITAEGRKAVSA